MLRYFLLACVFVIVSGQSAYGRKISKPIATTRSTPAATVTAPISTTTTAQKLKYTSTVLEPRPVFNSRAFGEIEIRPSLDASENSFSLQNYAEVGYKFAPSFSLSYRQQFKNEFSKDHGTPEGMQLSDGFLHVLMDNLAIDKELRFYFSYESRIYMPTDMVKRDAGLITSWRNYFKSERYITDGWSMVLWVVPILHVYSQTGIQKAGKEIANPIFENRVFFGPNFYAFNKRVALWIPAVLINTRTQDHDAAAENNDAWSTELILTPELIYKVTPNAYVGLAYESGDLLKTSTTTAPKGFDAGLAQFVFGLTF